MNFLAHIYLSGDNDLLKIGNFMADGIYGSSLNSFPDEIQKGILLHRYIDSYTDAHPVFRQSTKRLHPAYHHYAGVIVDIFYDHFLAKNWNNYNSEPLNLYTQKFYQLLQDNFTQLTDRAKGMIPYMVRQDWLGSYATTTGIARILEQMDRRTKHKSGMKNAIDELMEFYDEFEDEFTRFFETIRIFAAGKIKTL